MIHYNAFKVQTRHFTLLQSLYFTLFYIWHCKIRTLCRDFWIWLSTAWSQDFSAPLWGRLPPLWPPWEEVDVELTDPRGEGRLVLLIDGCCMGKEGGSRLRDGRSIGRGCFTGGLCSVLSVLDDDSYK